MQAIGLSRGGQTTKIHALTDVIGHPFALMLTPGNVADVTAAPALLARAEKAKYVIADKGYDADDLRRSLRQAGIVPVIPGRTNRKRRIHHDMVRYRERHNIENAFCRLKSLPPRRRGTSAASQRGMTNSQRISCLPSHWRSSWHSGYD